MKKETYTHTHTFMGSIQHVARSIPTRAGAIDQTIDRAALPVQISAKPKAELETQWLICRNMRKRAPPHVGRQLFLKSCVRGGKLWGVFYLGWGGVYWWGGGLCGSACVGPLAFEESLGIESVPEARLTRPRPQGRLEIGAGAAGKPIPLGQ